MQKRKNVLQSVEKFSRRSPLPPPPRFTAAIILHARFFFFFYSYLNAAVAQYVFQSPGRHNENKPDRILGARRQIAPIQTHVPRVLRTLNMSPALLLLLLLHSKVTPSRYTLYYHYYVPFLLIFFFFLRHNSQ